MEYATVCSGIEAPSVAWRNLNWKPLWFAQYDPEHDYSNGSLDFPSMVLRHHYPDVPNLGDMLQLENNEIFKNASEQLIIGGTPCQSFSIAGLRGGLSDIRGNLSLEFCRILYRKKPRWFVWENVPGVHSAFSDEESGTEGAFDINQRGEFIQTSDFARLLEAFHECGYSVCWRIFDSQYFGVPQRRRRVFVVGYLGEDWRPPFAVLFERESLRRDFTPGEKKGKRTAGEVTNCIDANYGRLQGASGQDINHGCSNLVAFGGNNSKEIDKATTVMSSNTRSDFESETFIVQQPSNAQVQSDVAAIDCRSHSVNDNISGTLQAKKAGYSLNYMNPVVYPLEQITCPTNRTNPKEGNPSPTLAKGSNPVVVSAIHQNGNGEVFEKKERMGALTANPNEMGRNCPIVFLKSEDPPEAEAFHHKASISQSMNPSTNSPTLDTCKTPAVIVPAPASADLIVLNDQGGSSMHVEKEELSPTLRANSHQNEPIVCHTKQVQWSSGGGQMENDTAQALRSNAEHNYQFVHQEMTQAPTLTRHNLDSRSPQSEEQQRIVAAVHATSQTIRRLTPMECERLQGFPDNYTLIPMEKVSEATVKKARKFKYRYKQINGEWWKMAADGPRYQAIGNSMTTHVVAWIGQRIDKVDKILKNLPKTE